MALSPAPVGLPPLSNLSAPAVPVVNEAVLSRKACLAFMLGSFLISFALGESFCVPITEKGFFVSVSLSCKRTIVVRAYSFS